MFNLILKPAYGAIYATKAQALAAWVAGKDFRIVGSSTYCSIRDVIALAQHHHNLILSSPDGGCLIMISPCKPNPLDALI